MYFFFSPFLVPIKIPTQNSCFRCTRLFMTHFTDKDSYPALMFLTDPTWSVLFLSPSKSPQHSFPHSIRHSLTAPNNFLTQHLFPRCTHSLTTPCTHKHPSSGFITSLNILSHHSFQHCTHFPAEHIYSAFRSTHNIPLQHSSPQLIRFTQPSFQHFISYTQHPLPS